MGTTAALTGFGGASFLTANCLVGRLGGGGAVFFFTGAGLGAKSCLVGRLGGAGAFLGGAFFGVALGFSFNLDVPSLYLEPDLVETIFPSADANLGFANGLVVIVSPSSMEG